MKTLILTFTTLILLLSAYNLCKIETYSKCIETYTCFIQVYPYVCDDDRECITLSPENEAIQFCDWKYDRIVTTEDGSIVPLSFYK
jgi:hypothetical protein